MMAAVFRISVLFASLIYCGAFLQWSLPRVSAGSLINSVLLMKTESVDQNKIGKLSFDEIAGRLKVIPFGQEGISFGVECIDGRYTRAIRVLRVSR